MVPFLMIAMMVDHYEATGKKIEPSVYVAVNEKLKESFQPRQYIRKIERKEKEKTNELTVRLRALLIHRRRRKRVRSLREFH